MYHTVFKLHCIAQRILRTNCKKTLIAFISSPATWKKRRTNSLVVRVQQLHERGRCSLRINELCGLLVQGQLTQDARRYTLHVLHIRVKKLEAQKKNTLIKATVYISTRWMLLNSRVSWLYAVYFITYKVWSFIVIGQNRKIGLCEQTSKLYNSQLHLMFTPLLLCGFGKRTCTNSGMVCMLAISPLFMGSRAIM